MYRENNNNNIATTCGHNHDDIGGIKVSGACYRCGGRGLNPRYAPPRLRALLYDMPHGDHHDPVYNDGGLRNFRPGRRHCPGCPGCLFRYERVNIGIGFDPFWHAGGQRAGRGGRHYHGYGYYDNDDDDEEDYRRERGRRHGHGMGMGMYD